MAGEREEAALAVLFCDNHVLAVVKPAGWPCVPDDSGDASLLERAREWVRVRFAKPGEVFLGVVHRLDRPVAGVVVFGRTSKGAARLSAAFRERSVRKTYWGVGAGSVAGEAGELEEWLLKDERANRVSSHATEVAGAQLARTRWRVLERAPRRTLLEFEPLTGRPHQLRSAARGLGAPLCGDLKYGAAEPLADASIALHAVRLELRHPTRDETLVFEHRPAPRGVWDFAAVARPAPEKG